jgi:hypothetical protein
VNPGISLPADPMRRVRSMQARRRRSRGIQDAMGQTRFCIRAAAEIYGKHLVFYLTCILGRLSHRNTLYSVSGASCLGMTIFQTSPYGMPVVTQFECVTNWVASTLYRELGNGLATTSEFLSISSRD